MLFQNNYQFHKYLTEGVDVEYRKGDRIVGDKVWLVDYTNPDNNEYLVINQFTIIEANRNKRPDVILFINGLPLVVIELKTQPMKMPMFTPRSINCKPTSKLFLRCSSITRR